jgi:hypothetical protein
MIGGAKILRDRFEELHGAFPDAEPSQEITEHVSALHAWTGTTADPDLQAPSSRTTSVAGASGTAEVRGPRSSTACPLGHCT